MNLKCIFFLCSMSTLILICQEQNNTINYNTIYPDEPIQADQKNFAEEYPELAVGFNILNFNFQEFMTQELNGKRVYTHIESMDPVSYKRQKTCILHNTIEKAEKLITEPLLNKFYKTISKTVRRNKNPLKISCPHIMYVRNSLSLQDHLLADLQQCPGRYQKILIDAMYNQNYNYIRFLQKLDVDFSQIHALIMTIACSYEHTENNLMILCTLKGADINKKHLSAFNDKTILQIAITKGYIQLTQLLLNNPHTNINISDNFGITPLMESCIGENSDKKIILKSLLMKSDLRVNMKTHSGQNALHFAAMYKSNYPYIPMLIQAGINIDSKDKYEWTPLHLAIKNNKIDNVVTLLQLGANKNLLAKEPHKVNNPQYYSCLDLAQTDEMKDILYYTKDQLDSYCTDKIDKA